MDSDDYLMLISIVVTAFATFISILLSAEWLSGTLFFGWMLAPLAFGLAVAGWHHKRTHRRFLVDAAILSMAASLGVLAAIISLIALSGVFTTFSSLDTHVVLGAVAFLVSFIGAFVVGFTSTFQREAHRTLFVASSITATVITIAVLVGFNVHVATSASSQVEQVGTQQVSHSQVGGFLESYASLEGTPIVSAYDAANRTIRSELATFRTKDDCSRMSIRIERCIDLSTDAVLMQTRYVIESLVLQAAIIDAANLSYPPRELSSTDLQTIRDARYTESARLETLSTKEAVEVANSRSDGPLKADVDIFLAQGSPVERALMSIFLSTRAGDEFAQLAPRVERLTDYYGREQQIIALRLLLDEDRSLETDPTFTALASQRLAYKQERT